MITAPCGSYDGGIVQLLALGGHRLSLLRFKLVAEKWAIECLLPGLILLTEVHDAITQLLTPPPLMTAELA
jgi:hypothetical protein